MVYTFNLVSASSEPPQLNAVGPLIVKLVGLNEMLAFMIPVLWG